MAGAYSSDGSMSVEGSASVVSPMDSRFSIAKELKLRLSCLSARLEATVLAHPLVVVGPYIQPYFAHLLAQ